MSPDNRGSTHEELRKYFRVSKVQVLYLPVKFSKNLL